MKHATILAAAAFVAAFLLACGLALADGVPDHRDLLSPDHKTMPDHWYDYECCELQHCYPLKDGSAKPTPMGYQLDYISRDGFRVTRLISSSSAQIRPSRDSHFHVCEGDIYEGKTKVGKWIRCLYVPGGDA
jgi:hypothetical protein